MWNPSMSIVYLLLPAAVLSLDNGFGRTPVMGYNTYNDVQRDYNDSYIEATINALADRGLLALGYKYFQMDGGWAANDHLPDGSITYDTTKFPDGILPLSQLATEKGFEWSMYTDMGYKFCDGVRSGSLGHEAHDAAKFASWGAKYVKLDNCYADRGNPAPKAPRIDFPSRFGVMANALLENNIAGIMICQWGVPYRNPSGILEGPADWTPALANSYRISDDIAPGWPSVVRILNEAIHINLKGGSGPGRFGDMDLLEVGNPGMTVDEQATHFAIWCMFKSALMISTSVIGMSQETADILKNENLIAVNQDPLGLPVTLVQRFTDDFDVFAGPLSNGDLVVLVVDHSNTQRTLTLDLAILGIVLAHVKDLVTDVEHFFQRTVSRTVNAHGHMALRLSNVFKRKIDPFLSYFEAESGRVDGGAQVQTCSGCSSGYKVGNIGDSSSLQFDNIFAVFDTVDVRFNYINCDIGYLKQGGFNERGASISVNGGPPHNVRFPLTGYNWDADVLKGYSVRLSGFRLGRRNSITITPWADVSANAPDFDSIGVPFGWNFPFPWKTL